MQSRRTGKPARRFKDFRWTTRSSWSHQRRVVAKAEWTKDEANPRFVVASLAHTMQVPLSLRKGLLRPRRHGRVGSRRGPGFTDADVSSIPPIIRRVDEDVAILILHSPRMCRFPASGSSWKSFAREGVAMDDPGCRQRVTL